jgi:DNA-binding CsgD family transcriptional regulator
MAEEPPPFYDPGWMEVLRPPDAERSLEALTPREAEVLRFTSAGRTNAQVAGDVGLSVHSVKFHLASIYRKLGVRNRTEAAAVYVQCMSRSST